MLLQPFRLHFFLILPRAMPWAVAILSPSGYSEPILFHYAGLFSTNYHLFTTLYTTIFGHLKAARLKDFEQVLRNKRSENLMKTSIEQSHALVADTY